jgi:hypothetical protein
MSHKFIFLVFFEEHLHATTWLKMAQGLKGVVPNKKLILYMETWIFSFFQKKFAHSFE